MGNNSIVGGKALPYAPNDTNMHYCRYRRTNLFTSTLDNFRFICSSSGLIQMDRAAFAYIVLCPCRCSGKGGSKRAAGRTPFASHSRFPCSPDRISQSPCSHSTGFCLTPGLLTLQFCLNDHRESPPISMPFLCRFSITSSMRKKPL